MILCTKCWDELFCIETNVTENKVSLSLNKVYLTFSNSFQFWPRFALMADLEANPHGKYFVAWNHYSILNEMHAATRNNIYTTISIVPKPKIPVKRNTKSS